MIGALLANLAGVSIHISIPDGLVPKFVTCVRAPFAIVTKRVLKIKFFRSILVD